MLITTVKIRRFENSITKLKGIANVVLDGMIVIHDIKILQNGDNIFLAMPRKQMKIGTFKDVVHPISSEVRAAFEKMIFFAYEETEKKHSTYLEMGIDNYKANSLLEQETEHFKIINASVASFQKEEQLGSREVIHVIKKSESTIDERLMKWLES